MIWFSHIEMKNVSDLNEPADDQCCVDDTSIFTRSSKICSLYNFDE